MDWKRVLQVVVCLVLVFSLFVGISPIRAEAVVTEAVLAKVTPELIYGLIIVALALASGFIVEPPDEVHYAALGEAFDQELPELVFASGAGDTDGDGTLSEDEIKEEVEKVRANIAKVGGTVKEQLGSPEWGQLDYKIYGDLKGMAAIMGTFLAGAIVKGYFETTQDVPVADGFAYYNGVQLPAMPEDYLEAYNWLILTYYPYQVLRIPSDHCFVLSTSDSELYARSSYSSSNSISYDYNSLSSSGTFPTSFPGRNNVGKKSGNFVWSDHDIYNDQGELVYSGSLPSSFAPEVVTIEPSVVVSDSAAAGIVAGGTASYSDIFVPEAIDLTSFFPE